MITITKERYIQLREAHITLMALQNGGVDNWEWYSESLPSDEDLKKATLEAVEHDEEN
jgi:hypothetical protein